MGKLAITKYLSFMVLVATVLTAIFTLFGLFGGSSDPAKGTAMAMLVYLLPLLIFANAVLFLVWLVWRRWHWLAIPGVTLLFCIPYVGTIYQPGWFSSGQTTRSGLMVATYNVASFGREINGFKSQDILTEMRNQKIDVLCIQEYTDVSGDKLISDSYKDYFTYMAKGRNDMVIYSRYPIEQSEIIDFGHTNNSGMWADIDVNGRELRIFNVHLETTGFNRALHNAAKQQLNGQDVEGNILVLAVYGNYTRGMVVRARQADQVAQLIEASELPAIVCGDFNDVPYSYTYETMLGDLVDGFKECGKGFMYTYSDGKKRGRIDYIFHDQSLEGENYYKLPLTYSDHYPVFMKINM